MTLTPEQQAYKMRLDYIHNAMYELLKEAEQVKAVLFPVSRIRRKPYNPNDLRALLVDVKRKDTRRKE